MEDSNINDTADNRKALKSAMNVIKIDSMAESDLEAEELHNLQSPEEAKNLGHFIQNWKKKVLSLFHDLISPYVHYLSYNYLIHAYVDSDVFPG